jgi:hypothetical protein
VRLLDLEARFVRANEDGSWQEVQTIELAQGVQFLCPKCFVEGGKGAIGCHSILCWSRSAGAPEDIRPRPGRWKMDGTGLADLTLNAEVPKGARSVLLIGGCGWHGFVTNGVAE